MLSNSDITEIVAVLKKSAFVSEEDPNNVIIGVSLEAVQSVLESYLDKDIETLEPSEELRRLDNVIDILWNTISLHKYRPISHSEYVSATKYAIDLLCKRREELNAIGVNKQAPRKLFTWIEDGYGLYRCPKCNHTEGVRRHFCANCGIKFNTEK